MNFPFVDTNTIGGLIPTFAHFTKKEWAIKAMYNRCGTMMVDPNINLASINFFMGMSLNEVSRLVENESPTTAGKLYKYSYSGKYKDSTEMQKVLAYMTSRRHYIIVQDRKHKARLLGKPSSLAEFTWSYDSETDGAGDALINYKIEWESSRPAPVVNFNLCNTSVQEFSPEGIGYWFIEDDFIVQ